MVKHNWMRFTAFAVAMLGCSVFADAIGRWSVEQARTWSAKQPWCCGVNYIPSNAINYTAMWDKTSFSPDLIRKELALMKGVGLNTARVFLQYLVYEDDPEYCIRAFRKFLDICGEMGVKAMPCFFDDCAFGAVVNPRLGKQDEPLIGWYSWDWTPSPGRRMVIDPRQHGKLEKYVKGMLAAFKDDPRVLAWDLYNEPVNTSFEPKASMTLLKKTFAWAREINPSQPLTTGIWNGNKELNEFLSANSDIITFHCYSGPGGTAGRIAEMKRYGRPVICTEWMNRPGHSTVAECLHLYANADVGCVAWGLVNGKTQTHLRWGYRPEMPPYKGPWQHDFFHGDFTPYDESELALMRDTIAFKNVPHQLKPVFAKLDPNPRTWAWTTAAPAKNWADANFDDAAWARSAGGFGNDQIAKDLPGTKVTTKWTTPNLWLRRHFTYQKPGEDIFAAVLDIHYDEDPEIYLNGKRIFAAKGYSIGFTRVRIPKQDFLAAVKEGDNVLAVKMSQTSGGQYFDLGLSLALRAR